MINAQKTNKKFVKFAKKCDIIAFYLENPIKTRYTMPVTRSWYLTGNGKEIDLI